MQKPDLIGSFRIASEKGAPLEKIKRSLISAGYNSQDVEDSAQAFSTGNIRPVAKPLPSTPEPSSAAPATSAVTSSEIPSPSEIKKKPSRRIPGYLLAVLIFSAVAVAGLTGYVIYTILK